MRLLHAAQLISRARASFQESNTHDSWRGFPRKAKTGKSGGCVASLRACPLSAKFACDVSRKARSLAFDVCGRTPKAAPDWRTAVRVGQKIDADRRKDLLAKAEKMAVRMRQSFLELDTSGDSRLDPDETLAMFQQSEAALAPVSFCALNTRSAGREEEANIHVGLIPGRDRHAPAVHVGRGYKRRQ